MDLEVLAQLAALEIDPGDMDRIADDLRVLRDSIDALQRADVQDVEPAYQPIDVPPVRRSDRRGDVVPADLVLEGAPERSDQFFAVPRTLADPDGDDR